MRNVLKAVWVASAILLMGFAAEPGDREAVEAAVGNYVDGLYRVDPSLIEASVSRDLAKYGAVHRESGTTWSAMSYDQLAGLAARYNADGRVPSDAPREIEVLHLGDSIASARLRANWGTDYLLLTKQEGRWMIRQVVWETPPAR